MALFFLPFHHNGPVLPACAGVHLLKLFCSFCPWIVVTDLSHSLQQNYICNGKDCIMWGRIIEYVYICIYLSLSSNREQQKLSQRLEYQLNKIGTEWLTKEYDFRRNQRVINWIKSCMTEELRWRDPQLQHLASSTIDCSQVWTAASFKWKVTNWRLTSEERRNEECRMLNVEWM